MDVVPLLVQVRRRDIALLCSLVGSYEGLGIARTLDAARGVVELMIAPAFYDAALALLDDLSRAEMPLRILKPSTPQGKRIWRHPNSQSVISAQAGIHGPLKNLDSRLRGSDGQAI